MSTDRAGSLGFFEVSGAPFDVGVQLGRIGTPAVSALTGTRAWATVMSLRHGGRIQAMAAETEARFPRYMAELRGLADGIGLPFDEIFAWNCRGDLWAMAPDGCTTIQVPGSRRVIAHNEDGLPVLRGHSAMVRVACDGGIGFTAFVYPGSLPGHTFAATDEGLVMTVNNIRSREASVGIPRMVLTRALLDCGSLDGAVALVRDTPRAGAFHLTLAQIRDSRLLSVEFTSRSVSVAEISSPGIHSNHLVHHATAGEAQIVTRSSECRQRRGEGLLQGKGAEVDPLAILRDTGGDGLPIRRDEPDDPDDENTLATAVFVVEEDRLNWCVYDAATGPARFRTASPPHGGLPYSIFPAGHPTPAPAFRSEGAT